MCYNRVLSTREESVATTDIPRIAITMGDPCGIGPEVLAKSLSSGELNRTCLPIVIGNASIMREALRLINKDTEVTEIETTNHAVQSPSTIYVIDSHNLNPRDVTVGQVSPTCGKAVMEWVTMAAKMAINNDVEAICTAPINKAAASLAGYKAIGHMELLQEVSNAPKVSTMLISRGLMVVHLTTHRSLKIACDYVKKALILSTLNLTQLEFNRWGMPNPRIGVAALNPHASDNGLLGTEEANEIAPAIVEAQNIGINAVGPIPADILFPHAIQDRYDVTLAMYHDQGHIPIKVHGFETSITVNLGLPFIRTSVDHGTAFDIAGKGIADHRSMIEAIKTAVDLSMGRGLPKNNKMELGI